jgi:hypothetical protein
MPLVKVKRIFHQIFHSDFLVLIFILIGWRIFVTIAGIIGFFMLNQNALPYIAAKYGPVWDMWTRWDGGHYLNIAANSYREPYLAAFFPLYPMLTRATSDLFHVNLAAAGLAVSHLALLGALYFVFKLAKEIISKDAAYITVLLLLFFPFSMFYGMLYTESLFLFLAAGSLYFARKENLPMTFLFSFAAALTRNIGVLLLFPLAVEYYGRYGRQINEKIYALFGPILGLLVYMIYLFKKFGTPFQFIYAQKAWGHKVVLDPVISLQDKFGKLALVMDNYDIFLGVEIICGLTFILLAILLFRKKYNIPKSLAVFTVAMLLPGLIQDRWTSVNRYVIVLFPTFMLLAFWLKDRPILKPVVLTGFSLLLGIAILLFVNFRWVG